MEQKNNHTEFTYRQFGLSNWALNNRKVVMVLTFIIFFWGVYTYNTVPKESFPEIVVPTIYVGTAYPGNSPEDIEKLITRPLEKEINTITDIDKMTSSSVQGYSAINIEFDFSISAEDALRKVKDAADKAMSDPNFPKDLPAEPNIFEMNFTELMPIMNINLSGDYSLEDLKDYAERLEDELEKIPQINKVDIKGLSEKEVRVEIDNFALEARQLNFNDIADALRSQNTTVSAGDIRLGDMNRSVKVSGEFKDMQDIENVIIKNEGQDIVYLRDVATVTFAEKEKESYAREFKNPVVSLDVIKRGGENLLEASDAIKAAIEEAKKDFLPSNLTLTITNDQTGFTRMQVNDLENNIFFGIVLVVFVIMFWLGLRNALFVGVAIPLTMLLSFSILSLMGVTLNLMVLFALILALGMFVDNSIVVVENINRLMAEGHSKMEAAKLGVGEVAWAIIISTLTNVVAYLPLGVWPGIMGQFMGYLPLTVIVVLFASLVVALIINPVMCLQYMRVDEVQTNRKQLWKVAITLFVIGLISAIGGVIWLGNILMLLALMMVLNEYFLAPFSKKFQNGPLMRLDSFYNRILVFSLKEGRKRWLFLGTFGLLILSFVLFGLFPPKVIFFPQGDPQYVNIFIEKPIGTNIEESNRITKEIEDVILDEVSKYEDPSIRDKNKNFLVSSVIANVGNGTSDPQQGPSLENTPHKGRITLSFVESRLRRDVSTTEVMNNLRTRLKEYPDASIIVSPSEMGPPQGPPVNIEVRGDNYDSLLITAQRVKQLVETKYIGGIEELKIDVDKNKPELPIEVDVERARRYGLSIYQVGDAIRSSLYGREVSTFKDGEDDHKINLRFPLEERNSAEKILNQKITYRDMTTGRIVQVPVSAIASYKESDTFSAVKRKDMDRVVTIYSNVLDGYNANEVVDQIKKEMVGFEANGNSTVAFTGQQEEQAKEMSFLLMALIIALVGVVLVLIGQFNSISTPMVLMFSILFSFIGVFLGLVIFRQDFVIVMTMLGIISLAGVVVNNAIVLIDFTVMLIDRRKEELGIPQESHLPWSELKRITIESGATRLRPVMLTAITTILGLVPLVFGLNIDFVNWFSTYDANFYLGGDNVAFWKPMSVAIIYGVVFSFFLTLIMVPVMFVMLQKVKYKYVYKMPIE
ncbi:MAG: efflux RND transporter permease subunit [Flavobacteriales bacterium]|jgi:multidrug efflux pump